jgi:hypothetical protein
MFVSPLCLLCSIFDLPVDGEVDELIVEICKVAEAIREVRRKTPRGFERLRF